MADGRKARDFELLDALDGIDGVPFEGPVWRVVREGRDPLQGHASAARWDPGSFDVLYTSMEPTGAVAEIYFHLSNQPVFPAIAYQLHEIRVVTMRTLKLLDTSVLTSLGLDAVQSKKLPHERTQAVGDAAVFLGFDGMIVPSARWSCSNLILFTDAISPENIEVASSSVIKWAEWREKL